MSSQSGRHRVLALIEAIALALLLSACQAASASPTGVSTNLPLAPLTSTPSLPSATTEMPLPTPSPTEIALPADYQFVFQGQTPESEAAFRASILRAYRWLLTQGVTETGPFTAFLFADRDQWVRAMQDYFQMPESWTKARINYGTHDGTHGPGMLTRWTGGALYELGERQGLTGDGGAEYLQAVMLNLAGLGRTDMLNDYLPAWLIQGSETYLYARMCDATEPGCFAARHAQGISESRIHSYMQGNLAMAERYGSTLDAGVIGFYALEYLSTDYGGDQKIIEWFSSFKTRQSGERWREVFQRVYGTSINEFYDKFDAYRAIRYPEVYTEFEGFVHGEIGHADNEPLRSGIWVFACPQNPTFDCVPTEALRGYHSSTGLYDPFWDWFVQIPMKLGEAVDITISFSRTADPQSVFGYYSSETGFTTDPAQAAVIHLKSGDQFDIGALEIPTEYLPPTVTPTPTEGGG